MASLSLSHSHSPLFSSLHYTTLSIKPTNSISSNLNSRPLTFRLLQLSASATGRPSDQTSPEIPQESNPDRIKFAFDKATQYKKSLKVDDTQQNRNNSDYQSGEVLPGNDGFDEGPQEVPQAVRISIQKAEEYKQPPGIVGNGRKNVDDENFAEGEDSGKEQVPEALRIAMEKAKEYKKNKEDTGDDQSNVKREQSTASADADDGKEEVPEALRIAMEKAKEYKKNKEGIAEGNSALESSKLPGSDGGGSSLSDKKSSESKVGKKEDLKISGIDFVGLDFGDKKKSRGLPAGLVPLSDPFPAGDLPEVEILVGDASKFGSSAASETKSSSEEESPDLYKPKVSTWGMFPRPSNISKTYGGGKNIRPGQALETPEDRAAKQARTRQLVAAYKRKIGLNMDPKLKAECEEALKDGDSLMDKGRLNEALPYYQLVMDKVAFQTELHGLAALQWSICQDSLSRPEQARAMYEKLQSHPNALVNKKAKQFMFSFQAMEMMKVTRPSVSPRNTGYQNYFEAFVEDKEKYASGRSESEEGDLNQAIPYIIFLAAPILIVILIAASKGV